METSLSKDVFFQLAKCSGKDQASICYAARTELTEESASEDDGVKKQWGAGNSETSQLPRSFAGLERIYAGKQAASLNSSALFAYSAHVVWWNFTKRESRNIVDHRCTV